MTCNPIFKTSFLRQFQHGILVNHLSLLTGLKAEALRSTAVKAGVSAMHFLHTSSGSIFISRQCAHCASPAPSGFSSASRFLISVIFYPFSRA
jgi:hypothetical protein